ncbi:zinc-finger domain-containing protein [Ancylobacter sp. G4_0304]|uniref:zinc-finger domain-containing protein n=1 Tax=Ancylobacter sp. G4_0304 TaxID=3114289 RepID=UPI0039C64E04
MAGHVVPHFHNSAGVAKIAVAAREFMCVGALPPYDHPHVFLDMGSDDEIVCPYCSTLYTFSATLHGTESIPAGCLYETPVAA